MLLSKKFILFLTDNLKIIQTETLSNVTQINSCGKILKSIGNDNPNKQMIMSAHLNINSYRNKFELLKE